MKFKSPLPKFRPPAKTKKETKKRTSVDLDLARRRNLSPEERNFFVVIKRIQSEDDESPILSSDLSPRQLTISRNLRACGYLDRGPDGWKTTPLGEQVFWKSYSAK